MELRKAGRRLSGPRAATLLSASFLALLPPAFFWRETLGRLTLGDQDAIFWFFPAYKRVAEEVRAGRLPLWNPDLYSGGPLFGQWQAGVLDPLNWIYLFGVTSRTLTLVQELSFALALLAAFAYCRSLGLRRRASVVAAVVYALSGYAVGRTLYPGLLHITALAPLALCLIERIARAGRWRDAAIGALLVAWQLFAAHPQPFVYSSMLAGAYALTRVRGAASRARFLAQCAAMYGAGAALAAVQLLPAWEAARGSVRQQWPYELFTLHSLHPVSLLGALFPFLHGQGQGIAYRLPFWGNYWHHNEAQIYLGALALALAAAGAAASWRGRWGVGRFWSVAAVVAALCALGKYAGPLAWLLYRVPLVGNFRSPNRHWMTVTLAVAVLAGYAVDRWLGGEAREVARPAQLAAGALAALCAVVGGFVLWRRAAAEALIRALPDLGQLPRGFLGTAGAEFFVPVVAALAALAAVVIFARWPQRRPAYGILLALLIADYHLYAYFAPISNPAARLESLVGRAVPPELAANEGGPLRYHVALNPAAGEFNPFWFYGHEVAAGYDPIVNERYKVFSGIDEAGRSHLKSMTEPHDRTLDLLNVRYLIAAPQFLDWVAAERAGSTRGGVTAPGGGQSGDPVRWREISARSEVGAYRDFRIYENLRALPRAWLTGRIAALPEPDQLRLIRGETAEAQGRFFNPREVALVDPRSASRIPRELQQQFGAGAGGPPGAVSFLARDPLGMTLETEAAGPAMLVLSEISYPGWHARVDGAEAAVWRVNYLLRGVALAPGRHQVELFYRPAALARGAAISVAAALSLGLMVWLDRRRAQKRASET